ncbi:MAG: hypothetical protein ACOC58_00410 [Chloroflexota bacterium]
MAGRATGYGSFDMSDGAVLPFCPGVDVGLRSRPGAGLECEKTDGG